MKKDAEYFKKLASESDRMCWELYDFLEKIERAAVRGYYSLTIHESFDDEVYSAIKQLEKLGFNVTVTFHDSFFFFKKSGKIFITWL